MDEIDPIKEDMKVHTKLVFFVNGKKVVEENPDPEWTLLFYLRKKIYLTGSKYGCGEGGCGACTVMLSKYDRKQNRVAHMAVNACLMPVCSVHGQSITTVEGIGSTKSRLHPVQERIAKAHGSQCGFCTPGIVMSMYTLIRNKQGIQYEDIETALQGNLCRCTGYRPIIESFKTFTEVCETSHIESGAQSSTTCALGKGCCKNNSNKHWNEEYEETPKLFNLEAFEPLDPSQEPIFPPEIKLSSELDEQFLVFKRSSVIWYRPKKIDDLIKLKDHYPNSKIVVGNTEVGVEIKFKKMQYPVIIVPHLIEELNSFSIHDDHIKIGSSVSMTEVEKILTSQITSKRRQSVKIFEAIIDMFHWFAGRQIRNVASMGGNIVTASPISDLNPILVCCGAALNVCSKTSGWRRVLIHENFFIGYRQTSLRADEVVVNIEIPYSKENQYIKAYKQSKRREDDISIVTGAFNVEFIPDTNIIKNLSICYGGMGPTIYNLKETSKALIGMIWRDSIIYKTFQNLTKEIKLDSSAPGGMTDYRKSLCLSMFLKFFLEVTKEIHVVQNGWNIPDTFLSATEKIESKIPTSCQHFNIISEERIQTDSVGKPITHISALIQATGEATYSDDLPSLEGELFLALVFSSKSNAKIISIDASEAVALQQVTAFFSAEDLKDANEKGLPGEEIFSSKFVTSVGNVLGAIVAENEAIARKAVCLVKVIYEEMCDTIISIEDAIEKKSYYPGFPVTLNKGDVTKAFEESDFVIEGFCRSGAQEHFYLETHSCLAIRREDELEMFISGQHPAEAASMVAGVLGIPNNKVYAKVKRIGGGFGGKETRNAILYLPVAIAAYRLNKIVRSVMDRDEDMKSTGQRHPHLVKYKVGFNKNGTIVGAEFNMYNNAGCTLDLSGAVSERASLSIDNCYRIPNVRVNSYVCKTNLPSNTAFRGFGAPQAMLATETMIRDIADHLGLSYEEILKVNLYRDGDFTHFNQQLIRCTIGRCWDECTKFADYFKRKQDVEKYNKENRWKKKGISIVPTKFGIGFGVDQMMQAGALIHIYTDGSVLVTIGGIEMGQGLFTKMIQVASRELGIDVNKIYISETATDKVPNASPTAGSVSSDLYGMAVLDACKILSKRLEPYKKQNLDGRWEDWISKAYAERISLSATGFYASPLRTNSSDIYEYFTYGVGCSEVIIDCLTGDHRVLRTDIVMDLGESINPAVDVGQVEGAFMQGYGFCTMEEMVYSPTGEIYSKGPGAYKIPGFGDIPREFNVSLLKGASNPRAVYSSKAVGEPPLFLASSVFFAIKEAISSARRDAGVEPRFHLDAPATCARIRMACVDDITTMVGPPEKDHTPWNIMA